MKSKGFPGVLRQWWEVIPPFQYKREVPYFQMLVPTMDTVRCVRVLWGGDTTFCKAASL